MNSGIVAKRGMGRNASSENSRRSRDPSAVTEHETGSDPSHGSEEQTTEDHLQW